MFCEKNIDLEVNEDKLVTEYFEITGGLTALWNGEEKTITELQSYLQDSDRHIRKKQKRSFLKHSYLLKINYNIY